MKTKYAESRTATEPQHGKTNGRVKDDSRCVTESYPVDSMLDEQRRDPEMNGVDSRADAGECIRDTDGCVAHICRELQSLQREKRAAMKLRIRIENSTAATVASLSGYTTEMTEEDRGKAFVAAKKLIKKIDSGEASDTDEGLAAIVSISTQTRQGYMNFESELGKQMERLCKQLPVASWIEQEECRGIGIGIVATIIGEAGDLSNYSNPAKLWRRLFGAPFEKEGEMKMPSTWRRYGGLTAEEWSDIGYSPRRHATTFMLKENIVMNNRTGPYRKRYDEVKERSKTNPKHEDWTDAHHNNHAKLLAAKRFVRDLWCQWNDKPTAGRLVECYR